MRCMLMCGAEPERKEPRLRQARRGRKRRGNGVSVQRIISMSSGKVLHRAVVADARFGLRLMAGTHTHTLTTTLLPSRSGLCALM